MNILTIMANDSALGGASRMAMALHHAYGQNGHETHVLAGKKTTDANDVSELKRPFWRKAAAHLFANDFDFFDGDQILRSPQFRAADIVHCHNLDGWYFNLPVLPELSRRKPVVWTLHDMWALTPHSAHTNSRELEHGLYRLSDPTLYPSLPWDNHRHLARRKAAIYQTLDAHIVTPCKWLSECVAPTALGRLQVSTIHNGIDMDVFVARDKQASKAELGLGNKRVALFVGYAARTNPFKGYEDFAWLAQENTNDNAEFVCVGAETDGRDGPVRLFAATTEQSRMATFLSAADIVVMPSRHDLLPLVMIESLACGTPIIAYDVGGIGEVLDGMPGCTLVPPLDRAALKQAVDAALDRPNDEMARYATDVRKRVENEYSIDRIASMYLNLFEHLISVRNGASP